MHILIIEGPPMSGKDSQAKMLVERRGYFHADCGDVLRRDPKFKEMTDNGIRVPDECAIDAILHKLPENLPDRLVITGFPRSIGQARWLRNYFQHEQARVSVIMLEVGKNHLTQRLEDRKKKEERPDDKPETLEGRLQDYHKGYGPEIRRFLTHEYTHLIKIDGNPPADQVWRAVLEFIDAELSELQKVSPIPKLEIIKPRRILATT